MVPPSVERRVLSSLMGASCSEKKEEWKHLFFSMFYLLYLNTFLKDNLQERVTISTNIVHLSMSVFVSDNQGFVCDLKFASLSYYDLSLMNVQ